MKQILKIVLIVLVLNSCGNLKCFNGYNGKPKIVKSTLIEFDPNETSKEKGKIVNEEIYYFFKKKRIIKRLNVRSDGSLGAGGGVRIYDKKGNLIQSTIYGKDSIINVRNNFTYNKYNQPLTKEYISHDEIIIYKNIYDRKKRTKEVRMIKSDKSFKIITISKFNKKWQLIESADYDDLMKIKTRIEIEYDNNGNQINSKSYNYKNELYRFTESTYNTKNDATKIKSFSVSQKDTVKINTVESEYKYDKFDNIVREKLFENGKAYYIGLNEIIF